MTGADIKKARLEKGLSLRRLGEATGVSAAFLCEIEKGKKQPSHSTAIVIAKKLNIPLSICPKCQGTGLVDHYPTPR